MGGDTERTFNKDPTMENLIRLKISRAKAQKIINEAKRQSWKRYVLSLTSQTPTKKIWDMIRKMEGKEGRTQIQLLKNRGSLLTTKKK